MGLTQKREEVREQITDILKAYHDQAATGTETIDRIMEIEGLCVLSKELDEKDQLQMDLIEYVCLSNGGWRRLIPMKDK